MNTQTMMILLMNLSLLTQVSFAEKRHSHHSNSFIDEARVIKVKPIYSYTHRYKEKCYPDLSVYEDEDDEIYDNNSNDYSDVIAGGLLGGLTGTRFGKGNGKKVATVAGSVTGAVVGDKIVNKHKSNHKIEYAHHGIHKKPYYCKKRKHQRHKTINGYKVKYRYMGHVFSTITDEHPGKFIDINIIVKPLG